MKLADAETGAPAGAALEQPEPTDRRTLPGTIAQRLRDMIMEDVLPPGARLNERALCEQLQVSRTPLREAFRLLHADGLVDIQPNRGAQVVALSPDDIRESFEVMSALEALSGRLACERISDREITEIRALTFEMQASHARNDLPAYYRVNREIHDRINAAGHNGLLQRVYQGINLRLQNLRFRSNLVREKWNSAMDEHLAMTDALEARDGDRLAAIMTSHLQHKLEAVLENLKSDQAADNNNP